MMCPMMIANNPLVNPKGAKLVPVKISANETPANETRSVRFQRLMFFCFPSLMPPLSIHTFKSNA